MIHSAHQWRATRPCPLRTSRRCARGRGWCPNDACSRCKTLDTTPGRRGVEFRRRQTANCCFSSSSRRETQPSLPSGTAKEGYRSAAYLPLPSTTMTHLHLRYRSQHLQHRPSNVWWGVCGRSKTWLALTSKLLFVVSERGGGWGERTAGSMYERPRTQQISFNRDL